MPLINGSGQGGLSSGEPSPLQNHAPLASEQLDADASQPTPSQKNSDLLLGESGEDVNLGNGQTQQEYQQQETAYENQSASFNEQRHLYTEKSFNSYDYEVLIEQIPRPDAFKRIGFSGGRGAGNGAPPPMPSSNPDSELKLSGWAEDMLGVNVKNVVLLAAEREKNDEKREKLEKKQPAERAFSLKDGFHKKRLSEREYRKKRKKEIKKSEQRERNIAKAKRTGRLLFDNENIQEDEDSAAVRRAVHKASLSTSRRIKRDVRNIRDKGTVYKRLKFRDKNDKLISKEGKRLKHQQGRILAINRNMEELDKLSPRDAAGEEAARRAQNRKIQQRNRQRRMLQREKERAGREITHSLNRRQHQLKKSVRKEKRIVKKRRRAVVGALASLIMTILIIIMIVMLFFMTFLSVFVHVEVDTVTPNDYTALTDVTEYLRNLETEVKKTVTTDRAELEQEIEEQFFDQTDRHVYEFVYDLPEFGFNDITLMAYLSAKFYTFDPEEMQAELEELCDLMYRQKVELKEEERTFYDADDNPYTETVIVCYITIEKTELEEVVEARLDGEAFEHYETYKLSGGGQQVYGPVMEEDWSGKISSKFGERIHPITGKKTFHDGIDIAVPTGTKLYSAVTGTVVTARYSTSAGNMVTVKTDSGWEITYMHMDSISVSVGQNLIKGQFVGCSGNTGNSTGPHLHIQVHDADGRRINPIFIIPQSGSIYEQE